MAPATLTEIQLRDVLRDAVLLTSIMRVGIVIQKVMFRFDVLVGEWPGIVEDECSMCLCRDEESERVRKKGAL